MKKNLFFVLTLLIVAVLSSCSKMDQNVPDSDTGSELADLKGMTVPDGFNWSTTADYTFNIIGGSGETVKITSPDGTVVYHKGTYIEDNGSYTVKLRLPSFVDEVKINSSPVYLNGGGSLDFSLNTKSKVVNYALQFDGVDDYVNLGDIVELNNASSFTIEGWANQASNTDNERIFLKKFDNDNYIAVSPWGGGFYIAIKNGNNSNACWTDYSSTISSNTWFHWAVVYDGNGVTNADKLKLYINGNTTPVTLVFTGTIPSTTSASLSGENAYLSPSADFFGGYMDEVRIWSTARTAGEIAANYNKIITVPAGLEAYYRMDEGEGLTLGDITETYNGTISDGIWVLYENFFDSDDDGVNDLNDDYWEDPIRTYNNYYPAGDTGTLAFEDLWPGTGDYDFNDLVVGYQFKTVTNALNEVVEIECYFEIRAHGAELDNGFGFQLPDAEASIINNIEVSGYSNTQAVVNLDPVTKLELGQSKPVVIVLDQVADKMAKFENVEDWKPTIPYVPMTVTLTVTGGGPYLASDFSVETWNPFMFIDQVRGYEVHKLDYPPTDLVNPAYFGTLEDASDPGNNEYYRTATGLPWVLEFNTSFEYPFEKKYVHIAYLHFIEWAESGGTLFTDWYSNTAVDYRNPVYIYH